MTFHGTSIVPKLIVFKIILSEALNYVLQLSDYTQIQRVNILQKHTGAGSYKI